MRELDLATEEAKEADKLADAERKVLRYSLCGQPLVGVAAEEDVRFAGAAVDGASVGLSGMKDPLHSANASFGMEGMERRWELRLVFRIQAVVEVLFEIDAAWYGVEEMVAGVAKNVELVEEEPWGKGLETPLIACLLANEWQGLQSAKNQAAAKDDVGVDALFQQVDEDSHERVPWHEHFFCASKKKLQKERCERLRLVPLEKSTADTTDSLLGGFFSDDDPICVTS
jgi:hypothetical protein